MGIGADRVSADDLLELGGSAAIAEHVKAVADEVLAARESEIGPEGWASVERFVLLRTIDSLWVEHLTELDDMRRGIGLRGYSQQDPLNEFKKEAFGLYDELKAFIRHGVANAILRVQITKEPAAPAPGPFQMTGPGQPGRNGGSRGGGAARGAVRGAASGGAVAPRPVAAGAGVTGTAGTRILAGGTAPQQARPGYTPTGAKIGRNDPCWCGSGLKYKKCHGR